MWRLCRASSANGTVEGTLLCRNGDLRELELPLGQDRAPLRLRAAGGGGASPGRRLILSLRPEDISSRRRRAGSPDVIGGEVIDHGLCLTG